MNLNLNLVGGALGIAALVAIFAFHHSAKAPHVTPTPTHVTPTHVTPQQGEDGPVFHRVEEGGQKGPQVDCKSVKPFAEGKSEAELQAASKQYGVTLAVVKTWYICLQ